ncbi:DNA-methyltransferase [Puniceicoccus vermicola]|uniref:Methyltransferase n=1 Tax=Puniceicoccus vermicola TaxID=388746 RepID=A0A7X1AW18_9BACT|nr:site-specific DNA-methyltransferase [Puniceicoccus vermicola]MBC2600887.1 site-specific DNA-methyltransferase [Puniceicoccus vermicola]
MWRDVSKGQLFQGDVFEGLAAWTGDKAQCIVADPPYFQVQTKEEWDNLWPDEEAYLDWTAQWVKAASQHLAPDGILYIFGQPGKREHVWLKVCAHLVDTLAFHDLIVWDRAVGYNERRDSFTPQFEMILALRHPEANKVFFDKDAVRIPYDEKTIQTYLRDNRYKDKEAREKHLRRGKYATNILRVPSLKGSSKEKIGHPTQKPISLIDQLIRSSSKPGDLVLDPFLGSGTTSVVCERTDRRWIGIESSGDYVQMTEERLATLFP